MAAEGYLLTIPGVANQAFIKSFKKAKGHYPTGSRGKSYLAVMFWAEAVKRAGSDKVAEVRKAWEGLGYDGPAGNWTMRACDHQLQQPLWIATVEAKNPFFGHAYLGPAAMVASDKVDVPCEETGCKGLTR